jgi:hypothetical protein
MVNGTVKHVAMSMLSLLMSSNKDLAELFHPSYQGFV